MIDREKVIKALECRKNADKRCGNPCEESGMCHYATAVRDINGEIYRPFICDREMICADALALLKEQEAIPPIPYHRSDGTIFKYECRKCRTKIFKGDLFCRHCGNPVLWEGR